MKEIYNANVRIPLFLTPEAQAGSQFGILALIIYA